MGSNLDPSREDLFDSHAIPQSVMSPGDQLAGHLTTC